MKLSIIILSYNTKELLKQTLDSIPDNPGWEIIIVDNASKDDSVQMIKQEYPQHTLIENNKNLGFAAANNIGMKLARGEYYLLLNSDVIVGENTIETLLVYMDHHPGVGAVTPKVVLPDGAIDLACHRGLPTPWRAFTYFSKLEQLLPNSALFGGYHLTHLDFTTVHEVEATAATAMLVRKKAIDQIGLLDEQFFFYAEDLDWSKRLTESGWSIVYNPEVAVVHLKSQSGKKTEDKQAKRQAKHHFYDTMKQFYNKHYYRKYPAWMRKLIFAGISLKKFLDR